MKEHVKIDEADYFLECMHTKHDDHRAFNHNLSAFLSASRSALQYALEEAKTKNGGQAWYEASMRSDAALKFLKDKRDLNIHQAPVTPDVKITLYDTYDLSNIRDSLSIIATDKDGNIISEQELISPEPEPEHPPHEPESGVERAYFFDDWTGPEDCVGVCIRYLNAVRAIVSDGVARGYLSGN